MKLTIKLKEKRDSVTGVMTNPVPIEVEDLLEVNINFQKRTIGVRFAAELGGARSESNRGEWSLDDIETYDWDDFSYRTVSNDALTQQKARIKMEAESELNRELSETMGSGKETGNDLNERKFIDQAKDGLSPSERASFRQ